MNLHVKKGDTVVVIAGKDKGHKGKILWATPKDERIVVEGANMIVRHTKPRGANQQGGRINKEGTMHVSNAMLVCGKCNKPTRVAHQIKDGNKLRVCKKCGKPID